MKQVIYLILLLSINFLSCTNRYQESPEMSNYDIQSLNYDGWEKATLRNIDDQIIEEGYFLNGQRAGLWVYYDSNGNKIEKAMNYIGGKAYGLSLQLNKTDQLSEISYYEDDKFHGKYESYQYGKKKLSAHYKNGLLDGTVTKYINFSNKVLSKATYKDGQLHGTFRQYDDEGTITLEYQYENGEKVKGGIVK